MRVVFTCVVVLATLMHAQAAPAPGVDSLMAPVDRFAEAFNRADATMPENLFTPDIVIADAFAPFIWRGYPAAIEWYGTLVGATPEDHQKFLAAKYHLTLGKPTSMHTEGDNAYLAIPGVVQWQEGETHHTERAQWLITLHKQNDAWSISSHSWAVIEAN